jgi:hypothetical protein
MLPLYLQQVGRPYSLCSRICDLTPSDSLSTSRPVVLQRDCWFSSPTTSCSQCLEMFLHEWVVRKMRNCLRCHHHHAKQKQVDFCQMPQAVCTSTLPHTPASPLPCLPHSRYHPSAPFFLSFLIAVSSIHPLLLLRPSFFFRSVLRPNLPSATPATNTRGKHLLAGRINHRQNIHDKFSNPPSTPSPQLPPHSHSTHPSRLERNRAALHDARLRRRVGGRVEPHAWGG